MVERLRALLERPLDPVLARTLIILACAVTAGFAVVVALGAAVPDRIAAPPAPRPSATRPSSAPASATELNRSPHLGTSGRPANRPQDPQDRPGSAAARRAGHELAGHRALQHVPFRRGGLTVRLVGAHGPRAVLAVRAPSIAAAHRGWRAFLRRFGDAGRAYLPRFEAGGRRG